MKLIFKNGEILYPEVIFPHYATWKGGHRAWKQFHWIDMYVDLGKHSLY